MNPVNTRLDTPQPDLAPTVRRRKDPILQELWDIKAQMNKAAGYDVRRLYEQVKLEAVSLFDASGRVKAFRA